MQIYNKFLKLQKKLCFFLLFFTKLRYGAESIIKFISVRGKAPNQKVDGVKVRKNTDGGWHTPAIFHLFETLTYRSVIMTHYLSSGGAQRCTYMYMQLHIHVHAIAYTCTCNKHNVEYWRDLQHADRQIRRDGRTCGGINQWRLHELLHVNYILRKGKDTKETYSSRCAGTVGTVCVLTNKKRMCQNNEKVSKPRITRIYN